MGDFDPEQFHFAITASGKDKSLRTPEDFLFVDQQGKPFEHTRLKPSAETLIHCEIYRLTSCGAIFHTHTVFNNVISEWFWERRAVPVEGVELITAFNTWEEEAKIEYSDRLQLCRYSTHRTGDYGQSEPYPASCCASMAFTPGAPMHLRPSAIWRHSSFYLYMCIGGSCLKGEFNNLLQ
ncbi:methylthioribulose-1-phosphate dehydratase [Paenibacillus sp. FSL H7-689]|nr:methylthioribulose-1-phosphate dehydratase [Paenibacillus sp. FSL H7-689]